MEAPAASTPLRPTGSRRTVRSFDFEERSFNIEPVPQYWVRAQQTATRSRPGFPPWNEATLDDEHASSGQWSVKIPVKGGSAALRLASGVIPVLPGADYTVVANVLTQGADLARARVAVRLVDDQHQPLPDGVAVSPAVRSEREFTSLHVRIAANDPRAAWMQIELQLLQPRELRRNADPFGEPVSSSTATPNSHRRYVPEDFDAVAWFDDVRVLLTPRVTLTTNSLINVVEAPQTPTLTAVVRDVAGETLVGELRLLDERGRLLDHRTVRFEPGGRPLAWKPKVQGFGWRRAVLDVETANGQTLSTVRSDFVYAPAPSGLSSIDARRVAMLLRDPPAHSGKTLAQVMIALGAGQAHLPLWSESLSRSSLSRRVDRVQAVADELLESGMEVTLALTPVPAELAQRLRIDPQQPLLLLAHEIETWESYLREAVARLGQRITTWRIGRAGSAQGVRFGPAMTDRLRQLQQRLERLAPTARVIAPWPGAVEPPEVDSDADMAFLLTAHEWFSPQGVANVAANASPSSTIYIEQRPGEAPAAGARLLAADLVKRLVHAWRTPNVTIALQQVWRWTTINGRATPQLTPAFAVVRQALERLSERSFRTALPAPTGATAMLFDGHAGAMLVVWADDPQAVGQRVSLAVGEGAVHGVDMFGNPIETPVVDGELQLAVSSEPIFVLGVDAPLLATQASFRIEPAFLPSLATRHALTARLVNHFAKPVSGALRIDAPESWAPQPRVLHFSLAPGEEAAIPFDVTLGVGEEAGLRAVHASALLQAGATERLIRLRVPVEVGLPTVLLSSVVSVAPPRQRNAEGDVVVTLLVTNTGGSRLTLEAFAQAPGFAREQAPISDLAPGQTRVARFRFRRGAEKLSGAPIRVGVMEVDGLARLNRVVRAP